VTKAASIKFRKRRGYTLLEVQVAFALLGIGLAGLCPLVVMQLRQVRKLELRLEGQVVQTNPATGVCKTMLPGNTYYIVPWTNVWAQKLAGSGQILTSATSPCDPGYLPLPTSAPQSYPVTIIELDAPPYSQSATAYVDVAAP
jgi:type II secretory pathway pseudopilin PulG